jgi:putative ABC transport system permease protein
VLGESVLLLVLGGVAGLGLGGAVVSAVRTSLPAMGPTSPMVPVGEAIWLRGLGLMVLTGLVVGALPALKGMRLRIVDALSGH